MNITVRVTNNYGVTVVYPACEQSKLLAQLAGTRTLTRHALDTIRKLGYEIAVEQQTVTL